MDFDDSDQRDLESRILEAGDVILLATSSRVGWIKRSGSTKQRAPTHQNRTVPAARPGGILDLIPTRGAAEFVRDAEPGLCHADKLARVDTREGTKTWVLVHVEVQGDAEAGCAERMDVDHDRLLDKNRTDIVRRSMRPAGCRVTACANPFRKKDVVPRTSNPTDNEYFHSLAAHPAEPSGPLGRIEVAQSLDSARAAQSLMTPTWERLQPRAPRSEDASVQPLRHTKQPPQPRRPQTSHLTACKVASRLKHAPTGTVSATEILTSGVSWPRKNTKTHGSACYFTDSVHFRVLPWPTRALVIVWSSGWRSPRRQGFQP